MKKLLTSALALLTATAAYAADEVRLQLQWVTQAQFAGYYVAL
ncbi:MAG: ABC transporter substrate-binding protein, partial [Rhodobacteraceae bacterium]|nr:ABC transporter substrate-binding protein [Paracoccaceae bacterium]